MNVHELVEVKVVVRNKYGSLTSLDDGDDNHDKLFFVVWLTDKRRLAVFPTRTIVRDPHHR